MWRAFLTDASGHQTASLLLHRLGDAIGLGRREELLREWEDDAFLLLLQLAQLGSELVAVAVEHVELLEKLLDIDVLLERFLDPIADLRQVAQGGVERALLGLLVDGQLPLQRLEKPGSLGRGNLERVKAMEQLGNRLMVLPDERIDI